MSEDNKIQRLVGIVERCSSDKTVLVRVVRREKHPRYHKYINRYTELLVHDEANEAEKGMEVEITACRPISKRKRWRITAVKQEG